MTGLLLVCAGKTRACVSLLALSALVLLAGCGKSEQAPQRPPAPVTVMTVTPQTIPYTAELRGPDGELAAGRHRRARVGLPGQDRLPGGRAGQGRPGAVPARPEAVPGAAAGRAGRGAVAAGALHHGERQPRTHQAARRAERVVAVRSGPGAGRVRRGQGRGVLRARPKSTRPSSISATPPSARR